MIVTRCVCQQVFGGLESRTPFIEVHTSKGTAVHDVCGACKTKFKKQKAARLRIEEWVQALVDRTGELEFRRERAKGRSKDGVTNE